MDTHSLAIEEEYVEALEELNEYWAELRKMDEDWEKSEDEQFVAEQGEQFVKHEKLNHFNKIKLGRSGKFQKFKHTQQPKQKVQHLQKVAAKREREVQKKVNDTYARNRRNARSTVLQEMKNPDDELDDDSYNEDQGDWIEKALILSQYGPVVYQIIFGGSLEVFVGSYVVDQDDQEAENIEREMIRYLHGPVVFQKLFGGPLEYFVGLDGIDTYPYQYI